MSALLWKFLEPILTPLVAVLAAVIVFVVMHFWIIWFHDPAIKKAAREGYVAQAEQIALQAQLDQERAYRVTAQNAVAGYAIILSEAHDRQAAEQEQTEAKINEYKQKLQAAGNACYLDSDADVDSVRNASR